MKVRCSQNVMEKQMLVKATSGMARMWLLVPRGGGGGGGVHVGVVAVVATAMRSVFFCVCC